MMARGRRAKAGAPAFGGMLAALRGIGYASPAYRLSLAGRTPDRLLLQPADMIPGDAGRGNALLAGEYVFAGQRVSAEEAPPWDRRATGEAWFGELQSFGWLRDLRAVATVATHDRAKSLVLDWIASHGAIEPGAWRPDLVARRVCAWLAQAEFLLRDPDEAFSRRFFQALALQVRHLARTARDGDGVVRLAAAKGLLYSGLCLPDGSRRTLMGLKLLNAELGRQVLPDGGHIERSPSAQLAVLCDLVDLRATLVTAQRAVPAALQTAIDRMAPMLRAYRHGDNGLALFNDSVAEEPWLIDLVLAQADARGRPQANAPHVGFRRIQAGRTLTIVDLGSPARLGRHAHAGTLSFETSVGKERLIVNCGAWRGSGGTWSRALRATAAHSTLTVDDTNSTELFDDGRAGAGVGRVEVDHQEQDGATWIEASHDGYVEPFGLTHRRRLYLSADGSDLRGEDILSRTQNKFEGGRSFAVRFHLHPEVQASLVRDGSAVLLRLPSGAGWQMRASGGAIGLNESIYAGSPGEHRRSEQIVITGPVEATETTVKWAFRRIPKG